MKKVYLQFLFLLMTAFAFAQTDVVVSIDVSANASITDVMFKGTPTGWADIQGYDDGTNGDATAGDNIWSATFTAVACDGTTHEWGAVDQDNTWLIAAGVPNQMFTVDNGCAVTGETLYTIPGTGGSTMVLLTVTDSNNDIGGISFKGSYGGWSSVPGYDDGTNGDVTAGDGIWTLEVEADLPLSGADPITYEWGADRTDCTNPAWIIQGANRTFTVDDAGNVAGELDYTVPLTGTQYNVTFRVYMGNEIVSADGVSVSGEFEMCPWSFGDVMLTQHPTDPDVYQATYAVAPGIYRWKFANEIGENEGGTPSATVFQDNGCGVDNGLGGSNRETDLTAMTADVELPIYVYNTCDLYEITSTKNVLNLDHFEITPNPASDVALINFSNENNEALQVTITSITGQVVQQLDKVSGNQLELSVLDMSTGMYFVTLTNNEGASVSRKFVVR